MDTQRLEWARCLQIALKNPYGKAAAFPTQGPPAPTLSKQLKPAPCSHLYFRWVSVSSGPTPSFLAVVKRSQVWMTEESTLETKCSVNAVSVGVSGIMTPCLA